MKNYGYAIAAALVVLLGAAARDRLAEAGGYDGKIVGYFDGDMEIWSPDGNDLWCSKASDPASTGAAPKACARIRQGGQPGKLPLPYREEGGNFVVTVDGETFALTLMDADAKPDDAKLPAPRACKGPGAIAGARGSGEDCKAEGEGQ